jgi:hypothetical protein
MKEIRAFVEREAKFVFAHLLENKGITAKRRQTIEERSIDYAVNLLPRKEIFDDVIMMTQPGCIAAVSMARFGPHYLVALSDDFPDGRGVQMFIPDCVDGKTKQRSVFAKIKYVAGLYS